MLYYFIAIDFSRWLEEDAEQKYRQDEGALGNHAIREPSRASDHGDRGSPGADVDRSCVKKYTERDRDRDRERDRDKRDRSRSREKSRSR